MLSSRPYNRGAYFLMKNINISQHTIEVKT